VRIAPLSEEEVLWYVATGEPRDKAGAYAVQGKGSRFIESIDGSYTNVMGLPARGVYRLLRAAPDPGLARLALAFP
jgi:septum formation protein